jgi:ABC-2 type transport system permease protein
MAPTGGELDLFKKIITKYDNLSDKINVEYKDPVLYPTFAKDYTDQEVSNNSLIVVNNTNGRSKYVPYNDMIVQETDYQTYQTNTTGVDVEGELTSAIQYVTTEDLPAMYVLEGHGETAPGDLFKETVSKMNVKLETINTQTTESIPEDCKMLYINAPTMDFSDSEAKIIKDYLNKGGNIIATVNDKTNSLKNYKDIINYYGIEVQDGKIVEGNADNHISGNPILLVPNFGVSDIVTGLRSANIPVVMYQAMGLAQAETKRSTLKLEPIMTTSDAAYSKMDITKSVEKESGDVEGTFDLGILATDSYNGVDSHLIVYSTLYTFDETALSYENAALLSGTVSKLVGEGTVLSIPTKSLGEENIYPTAKEVIIWVIVIIFLVPVAILAAGIAVTLKRRKK